MKDSALQPKLFLLENVHNANLLLQSVYVVFRVEFGQFELIKHFRKGKNEENEYYDSNTCYGFVFV